MEEVEERERQVEEKGLKLSITEGGKEGKYLEHRFQDLQQEIRSCFGGEC